MNPVAKKKEIIASAVAIAILTAIFVPFQKANAYTVDLTLPNASTGAVPTSAVGSTFEVTIDVAAGELISVSSVELILDNNNSGLKSAIFDSNGHRTSGDPTLVRGNLDITIPAPSQYGYGYGYGYASTGTSLTSQYSYAIPADYAYVGGNTGGYSYAVSDANFISGFVGPGQIVIEGKLNTAQMAVGTHTLDVLIHTDSGGNGVDKLVAPQLTFTTVGNSSISSTSSGSGNNVTIQPTVTGVPPGKLKLIVSNIQTGGTLLVEPLTPIGLNALLPGIFSATGANLGIFNVGGSSANSVGTIFEIDTSSLTLGSGATIDVTIPYDPTLLPTGFNEANVKLFHYTGTAWEDVTVSVDTTNDTVTGRVSSLSPVVAGFIVPSASVSTSGGGGGGGGSSSGGAGGSSIDLTTTYEDSYFVNNPLAKIQFQNSGIVNAKGVTVYGVHSGQQVNITSTIKNYQKTSQNYAMIVQILDKDGFTSELGWVTGTLASGDSTDAAKSWTTGEPGSYTVKLFVWNGVTGSPSALSEITTKNFVVS